jgi:class 3 adenylate cyclase
MPPDALQTYMNRYYQVLFEPVRAHAGVVSDVIGEARCGQIFSEKAEKIIGNT